MIDLNPDERQYLLDVLRAAHTDLLHEIHHTRTRRFAIHLKETVAINERLTAMLTDEDVAPSEVTRAGYLAEQPVPAGG